jgi:uncharacterized protein YndB with AHSA1/START domain
MQTQRPVQVTVRHRFAASAERVFDAWVDPEVIAKWMLASPIEDEEIVRISVDARVGGRFSFVVRRQGEELDHLGTYLEVERPRRLVFTWGVHDEPGETSRVIVEIAPVGDGCEVTLTHEMAEEWREYAERTAAGWGRIMAVMEAV